MEHLGLTAAPGVNRGQFMADLGNDLAVVKPEGAGTRRRADVLSCGQYMQDAVEWLAELGSDHPWRNQADGCGSGCHRFAPFQEGARGPFLKRALTRQSPEVL
jgi:hypothetical protein